MQRPVDLDGVARIQQAIGSGWLLHFPAGTTKEGAPIRPGVARILYDTKAVAVPVRVEGFRRLLLLRQAPGKLFRSCSIRIHPPLDLTEFYARPLTKESGAEVIARLALILEAPDPGPGAPPSDGANGEAGERKRVQDAD